MDKLRELKLDRIRLVFYTTDNGAWQDVYPDAGYTPFVERKAPFAKAATVSRRLRFGQAISSPAYATMTLLVVST